MCIAHSITLVVEEELHVEEFEVVEKTTPHESDQPINCTIDMVTQFLNVGINFMESLNPPQISLKLEALQLIK